MPKIVTAHDGDTLCGIAMDAGFLNCDPLRAVGANAAFLARPLRDNDQVTVPDIKKKTASKATTRIHTFLKKNSPPVSIRLVHGSEKKKYLDDSTSSVLNISNYVPDAGGLQGDRTAGNDFPTTFGFNKRGDEDEDTFKVEVVDPAASGVVHVTLEVLRPILGADGSIDHHDTFAGSPDAADRRIDDLECQRVEGGHVAFRSRYLRLVVDKVDQLNKQHLLVTDMVDAGDKAVEILDQNVRATYVVQSCKAAANKCQVTFTATINRGKAFDVAIRVMRAVPTGVVEKTPGGPGDDGIVKLADIRTRMLKFARRCWAQAHIKPNIVTLQTMDLPSDMITVADATGLSAKGHQPGNATPGRVGFKLSVQRFHGGANSVHVIDPFDIPAGNPPLATANMIKAKIDALPGLLALPSLNRPEIGDTDGSCDLFIKDASGGRITITNMNADQDENQTVEAIGLDLTIAIRNADKDYHVGHPEQRNLVKSLDTGSDTVLDISVVGVVPHFRGFTVPERKTLIHNLQPVDELKNSIIMPKVSSDGTQNNPFSLPHELGHILTDEGNHSLTDGELMHTPTSNTSSNFATDTKRLVEHVPAVDNWDITIQNADGTTSDQNTRLNITDHINTTSGHLLH